MGLVSKRFKALSLVGSTSALLFGLGGTPLANARAAAVPPLSTTGTWPPSAVLNPFSPNAVPGGDGLVNPPLAYFVNGNQSYVPEVAASWTVKKLPSATDTVVTLHLRHNARWSNGTPMTSADVRMSLELGYIFNYQLAGYVQSITTPNRYTVVVRQNNKPFNLFVRDLLTTVVYPAQEWQHYIPANVASLYQTSEGTGKSAQAASAKLAAIAKRMAAVNIKHYISGGPFNYTSVTSDEIVLTKNKDFWNATKVHVPVVDILASSGNSQQYSYALSGRVDLLSTFAPPTVIDPFISKPGDHILAPNGNYGPALVFNTADKPFNELAVRQALAYIINRTEAERIAYPTGTSSVKGGVPVKYPSGLPVAFYSKWFTPKTIHELNPYNRNLKEAARLLESAGIKKVHGQWMYNGKPFSFYVACPSGYSDWVAISENIATQLSQFGIHATLRTVDTTTYFNEIGTGKFPVALNSVGSSEPGPWVDYNQVMYDEGLTINVKGVVGRVKTTYNWGPTVDVKDVGKINVVKVWNNMLQTNDHAQIKKDVNELALAINQSLPMIDLLYNKVFAIFYNTNTYTDYPSPNSPYWTNWIGGNLNFEGMVIGQGYIRPK